MSREPKTAKEARKRNRAADARAEAEPGNVAAWIRSRKDDLLPQLAALDPSPALTSVLGALHGELKLSDIDLCRTLGDIVGKTRWLSVLTPLVEEMGRFPDANHALTTTKGGLGRQPAFLSEWRNRPWEEIGRVESVIVDGQPLVAQLPEVSDIFGPPEQRRRVLLKPHPQGELVPDIRGLRRRPNLMMTALEGLPPLAHSDASLLMALVYAASEPLWLDEHEGGALLARTRDGGFRRPRASDRDRFRQAARILRQALIYDPHYVQTNKNRWAPRWLDIVNVQTVPELGVYQLGPAGWTGAEKMKGRWLLTAQGSQSTARISLAGEQGVAGQIVNALEYRLYARHDGIPGPGPDVRPRDGTSGAGETVFVSMREILYMAQQLVGEPGRDQAAEKRFRRAIDTLLQRGYGLPRRLTPRGKSVPLLSGEAEAGDTVEIVGVRRGGNGRHSGLLVRASARFTAAAAQAARPKLTGFERVTLLDYAGRPLME